MKIDSNAAAAQRLPERSYKRYKTIGGWWKMKRMLFGYVGPISGLQQALDEYIKQLDQLNEDDQQDTVDCDIQR